MRRLVPLLIAVTSCYLPGRETILPIANQVQVPVYRCNADFVSGDILNNADVPIVVMIKAKWVDSASTTYHEVEAGPFSAGANSSVQWVVETEESVADPAQCLAEIVSVTEEQP
ncbi:MAG TPA: hypothetical protein VM848_16135 [Acidimicrobiia bacterium]|nr:hypothetical protein [Acidimicrobiia bacterium]